MDENRVEGLGKNIGGKVESLAGDVTGDPKLQADGLIDKTVGKAQQMYGSARDAVKDMGGDYGSQLLDQVEEYGDMLAEKVDERPITAVLIAVGIGFLLALATKPATKVVYRRR